MVFLEFLKAILIGIIEGITEWLPISSTGHMILVDEFVKLNVSDAFKEMFFVVIQLGAIAAVPVFFWNKLNPFSKKKSAPERRLTWVLWSKVIVGVLPAAVIGLLLDDIFDKYFYNYVVVAIALVVYGVLFIVIEKHNAGKEYRINSVHELSYKDSLMIGAFQVLALIPGTSRSGSTIIGGMLGGVSRVASAEFSFFMAIPVMLGASLLKALKFFLDGFTVSGFEVGILLVAMAVSFVVSILSIKFLMDFVKKHSFSPFGVYRIVLGAVVVGYFLIGTII